MPKIGWKYKKKLKFWHNKIVKNEEISWNEELSHPYLIAIWVGTLKKLPTSDE